MLKNYIKIAFRNILRNKLYSFINIVGMAIGIAASIMIFLWVSNELSYDKFNQNLDRIFLVAQTQHYRGVGDIEVAPTPLPLAQTLEDEYPEIEYSARYEPWLGKRIVAHGDKHFDEEIDFADPDFFRIFTYKFLEGDEMSALTDPSSIVLTRKTASKLFGDEDPVGKTVRMDGKVDLKVTGVIEDPPKNSDKQFNGLVPVTLLKDYGYNPTQWGGNMIETYILLKNRKQAAELTNKIKNVLKAEYPAAGRLSLFPFKDLHLYTLAGKPNSTQRAVLILSIVGFFILLLACINFMNLSTARSARRATEVGIRKTVGATRFQLTKQFFAESIVLSSISMAFALVLVEIFLPFFDKVTGKTVALGQMSPTSILAVAGIAVGTAILAGAYPSIYLSSFKPASILKKGPASVTRQFQIRRILIVFQFAVSIALIVCTSVVYLQLHYIFHKNNGLNLNRIVYFRLDPKLVTSADMLKTELDENPSIVSATTSYHLPIDIYNNGGGWRWQGKPANEDALVSFTSGDCDYLKTFGIRLIAGRFFSSAHPADDSGSVVINKTFAKLIGKNSPLGMQLTWGTNHFAVIGVVNDFNYLDLHSKIGPLAIFNAPQWQYMSVKVNRKNLPGTIAFIRKTCEKIDPGFVFNYHFMDNTYEEMYASQERLGNIFGAFACLAVIIACLGLLGLSSFTAETRTKEVGIRKVLGASVSNVVYLLSRELITLALIGNVLAWPVAYYFMQKWLQTFAYRIGISPLVFIFTALVAVVIAAATTGYQAAKAATTNPVESLRYE